MNRPSKRSEGLKLAGMLALLWLGLALIGPAHAGTKHYYYTDAQGTVLAKTDAQGNIVARYDYKPYGAKLPGPQTQGPTGYTGHVNDAETGLVYMQARYYDPVVGRFLSVDPVGPKPGNGFGFNRYAYGNNNPARYTDPDGRCALCAAALGLAAGAAIGAGTDYLVQKAFHPGKPVNKNEIAVAAALGAFSAGTGALAVAGVETGALTVTAAVESDVLLNGVAGGAGRAIQGQLDGVPATNQEITASAIGNAVGTLGGNGAGIVLGDFSQAASKGAAARMSKAAINSPAGIGASVVNTTAPIGIGRSQSARRALLSQAGKALAQGSAATGQSEFDDE